MSNYEIGRRVCEVSRPSGGQQRSGILTGRDFSHPDDVGDNRNIIDPIRWNVIFDDSDGATSSCLQEELMLLAPERTPDPTRNVKGLIMTLYNLRSHSDKHELIKELRVKIALEEAMTTTKHRVEELVRVSLEHGDDFKLDDCI